MRFIVSLLSSLLIIVTTFIEYQDTDEQTTYGILYRMTFKPLADYDTETIDWIVVYKKGDSSIHQSYNARKKDSIRSLRTITNEEQNNLPSRRKEVIEIAGNELKYKYMIGNDPMVYIETIDHDWKLMDSTMTIAGQRCKMATTTYGGRNWTAWYSMETPLNAGPYKFKNLPGLIVKCTDDDKLFDFELHMIQKTGTRKLTAFVPLDLEKEQVAISRKKFMKARRTFDQMNIHEAMNYMNRDKPGNVRLVMVNPNTREEMKISDKVYKRNYIEIDVDEK